MPEVIHITCNMGSRDLPDMYVCPKPLGLCCGLRALGIYTYQANPFCPCYNLYIFEAVNITIFLDFFATFIEKNQALIICG